jgi:DNA polymerase I-like protein with 3'-5' exonuclease and polymerase domains
MALFDMPSVRGSKEADKALAVKSKTKSALVATSRGTSLIDRINLIKQTVEQKLGKYKDRYRVITDIEDFSRYIDKYIENGIGAIDTETTGLDTMLDTLAGICLYTPGEQGVYVPLNHVSYITGVRIENQLTAEQIRPHLERLRDSGAKNVEHHSNFDIRTIMYGTGVRLKCHFDTLIASQMLNENEPHGLKVLHQKYVLDGEGDAWTFGKLFDGIPFTMIPINTAYLYAARDPEITFQLYEFQLPYLTEGTPENVEQRLQDVAKVFWNIEMPFVDVIISMEHEGIAFDFNYQQELHDKYSKLLQEKLDAFYGCVSEYEDRITNYRLANPNCKLDDPINISSPIQLAVLLYDIICIGEIDRKTPRGTGEKILEQLELPIAKAILEYRGVEKLMSTYIDKLPDCVNPNTGKIHCQFNQNGARTGRLSSENPNLQNIPSHNMDIRKLFIADEGCVLLSSDYSQQEVKLFAELSQDPVMIQALTEGKDVYSMIAAVAFNTTYDECREFYSDGTTNKAGKERRSQAKSIVLGILYGRQIASIAEQLGVSVAKAQKIRDDVITAFPNFATFEEDTLTMAEQLGYVTTLWGRKRRLPEMQLPMYEFEYLPGHGDTDPLSFDGIEEDLTVPYDVQQKYLRLLKQAHFGRKKKIFEQANEEGIYIVDNEKKISDTTRQCVNARVQGSAADLTKLAGIEICRNERLKELGFKLLIPIHDEYLGMCPIENAKECAKLFAQCMSDAARRLSMPINCDVSISDRWYGEEITV